MRTARKAGLKPKETSQKRKYVMPTPPMSRRSFSLQSEPFHDRPASICCEEELSSESFLVMYAKLGLTREWFRELSFSRLAARRSPQVSRHNISTSYVLKVSKDPEKHLKP